ncbi:sigma-70 family RNA polymerase sigma factor [Paenibacillus piscarius]|uniref:sigma-70 family RNA polymerase sigma factor n=1 Tax=Paenibacillus piscarius TaxID=1089681 RepID=UPI001EE91120|nr:sigma-70 family RNA polymerase sigma factor [Paenibacillus piscarius]
MSQDTESILAYLNRNPIIKNFLNDKSNYELLLMNIKNPTLSNKNQLDEAFKTYFFEIRFISYISSLIRYSSIDFDKKERIIQKRMVFTLDDFNSISTQDYFLEDAQIESIASTSLLYNGIKLLTKKEKEVLEEFYINGLSDTEISKKNNVSQQATFKIRTKALKKLREFLTRGECE